MFISHFSSLRLLEVLIVQQLERSGWTLETFGEKAHFWIRFIGTGGLDLDTFFGRTQANSLEEGMATHSSILAWRIPQTEEPGGLQSVGSQSARHNRSDWVCMHTHTGQLTTEDDSLQIPGTNLDNKKVIHVNLFIVILFVTVSQVPELTLTPMWNPRSLHCDSDFSVSKENFPCVLRTEFSNWSQNFRNLIHGKGWRRLSPDKPLFSHYLVKPR